MDMCYIVVVMDGVVDYMYLTSIGTIHNNNRYTDI